MNLFAKIATMMLAPKARAFEEATKDPLKAQEKVLFEYLARNKDTEYGRKYNFAGMRSIDDYRRAVPLNDCKTIRPYTDRMKRGEDNILTIDRPVFFGTTSGTTGIPKYIPVTKFSREKKAGLMALWTYYILRDHPDVLNGKVLAMISPDTEGVTESGLPYGAESGHAYKNMPGFIKRMYAIPYEVFTIADYAARYYCILRIGIGERVSTLAALNPSAIVLWCQKVETWKEKIISDIENGSISRDFEIPREIRSVLEKGLKPDPGRAGELRAILKDKGKLLPKDFWPEMRLIECWKGGTVKLYLKELPQYFGNTPVRDFGCLSTEARTSISISDEGAASVLAIETNFYEFVPKEDAALPQGRTLLSNELEKGKEYFIIVTTPGGLYRYDIDDVVRVAGFFNKTPMIEFVQKGLNAVSLTGEKMYESQVNAAVLKAVEKTRTLMKFFSATIETGVPGRYIFLVEFDGNPAHNEKAALLKSLEEALRIENREYNDLRNEGVLGDPVMKVVRCGDFERYRQKKVSEGAHDGQFKAPELTGDLSFQDNFSIVEEISAGFRHGA